MDGGLHFLVEIELEMAKMPAFTNLYGVTMGEYGRISGARTL